MVKQFNTLVEEFLAKCSARHIPLYCLFELTYRCNLRCVHCYISESCDYGNELSFEEIDSIFDDLIEMGTFYLVFTGGEILVRDDFFDIAESASSKGFFIILMTNGTIISSSNIDRIAKLKPMGVEISLYGSHAGIHDRVTGVAGSFDLSVEAIKLLVNKGIRVTTKTVLMDLNIDEYEEIEPFSKSLGAMSSINPKIIPKKDGSLLPLRHDLFFEGTIGSTFEDDSILHKKKLNQNTKSSLFCKAGRAVCSVSPFGDVSPCLLMPIKLGNIREKNIADIWYQEGNDTLNNLRYPNANDQSICSGCNLLRFCNRCPGVAYIETGNPFGCSPSARRHAEWQSKITSKELINYEKGR